MFGFHTELNVFVYNFRSNEQCFHPENDVIRQFRGMFSDQSAAHDNCCPGSFKVELERYNWTSLTPLHDIIEYFDIDFECARSPDTVSFYKLDSRDYDFFVSDPRGVNSLFKPLYSRFKNQIHLGEVVRSIEYTGSSVVVNTSRGLTYVADYAVCTFSSNVILSDISPIFKPRLPRWKIEAYSKAPLGLYTKIFVKFPRQFWEDNEYILHVSSKRGWF